MKSVILSFKFHNDPLILMLFCNNNTGMKTVKNDKVDHHESMLEVRIDKHVSRINHINTAKLIILIVIIALTGFLISVYGAGL